MSEDDQPPWAQDPTPRPRPVLDGARSRAVQTIQQHERAPVRTAAAEKAERRQVTYQAVAAIMKDQGGVEAKAIKAMLGGDDVAFQRYVATVFSLLATKPEVLEDATPASIVNAVKVAAGMGLEPLTSDGGIVVYGDVATFMPQWQGYLKRIRNSGQVRDVDVQVVYEGDGFRYGTSQAGGWFVHEPTLDPSQRGGYKYFYAYAVMPSGFVVLDVMTAAEVNEVRDRFARGANLANSPWVKSYAEMGRKTVVRRLSKRLPQSAVRELEAAEDEAQRLEDRLAEQAQQIAATREAAASARDMALIAVGQLPAGPPEPPENAVDGPGAAEGAPVAE